MSHPSARALARLVLLALLVGAGPAAAQPFMQLRALAAEGGAVTARVVDLDSGRTLAALNPGRALTPASVSKLYTATAALRHWGAAYRFTTRALYLGQIHAGVLHGDLVLRGAGDPDLTNAQLWTLAERVREAGVRQIAGTVVVDQSLLGQVPCLTPERCTALTHSSQAYDAPLSAVGFDYSNACVRVVPARTPGAPARIAFEPFKLPMFGLTGTVKTLPAGAATHVLVTRVTSKGRNWFYIRGGIAANSPARCYYRSVAHPALYSGQALIAFLRQAGIKVSGSTVRVDSQPVHGAKPLAEVKGTALGEQLRGMLVYSNNYMADLLGLDLARTSDRPPITMQKSGAWLTRYARRIDAESPWPGARHGHPRLNSGSGLTATSRVSANDLIALLAATYRNYADFPTLLGALTVPDQTPVNMLKSGPRIWATHVAAKTGSLWRPVSVFALAGYLRLSNGHWGAFAVIVNGTHRHREIPLERSLAAVRAGLVQILRGPTNELASNQANLRPGQSR